MPLPDGELRRLLPIPMKDLPCPLSDWGILFSTRVSKLSSVDRRLRAPSRLDALLPSAANSAGTAALTAVLAVGGGACLHGPCDVSPEQGPCQCLPPRARSPVEGYGDWGYQAV
jgi:hypothetical protein